MPVRHPSEPSRFIRGEVLLAALVLSLLLLLKGTVLAFAHAGLVRSDPPAGSIFDAPPSQLRLWFSEAPEPRLSEVRLLDSTGRAVQALGEPRTDPSDSTLLRAPLGSIAPGIYTVAWRTTSSVDGHVTSGAFAFTLGRDQAPGGSPRVDALAGVAPASDGPSPLEVAIRWAGYLGMSLLMGGFAFLPLVLRPALGGKAQQPGPESGREDIGSGAHLLAGGKTAVADSATGLILSLLMVGWAITTLSCLAGAVAQAATSADVGFLAAIGMPLERLLGGTRYGALFWVRFLLLQLLAVLLIVGMERLRRGHGVLLWWSGLAGTALALLTVSLGSHAASDPNPPLSVLADWLHLMSAAVWAGGLIALVLILRRAHRSSMRGSTVPLARLIASFSLMATWCVVALGLTGPYRAIGELGSWEDLFDTSYGSALLVKLGLLAPLLGLAFVNRFLIRRRLESGQLGAVQDATGPGPWYRPIVRAVGAEVFLVWAVLLATSVLATLPPSTEAYGSGLLLRGQEEGVSAVLVVNPGHPGLNNFDIYLRGDWRRPVTDAEKVALIFSSVESGTGRTEAVAQDLGNGHYQLQGSHISMAATWQIQLLVRQPGREDVRLNFTMQTDQLAGELAPEHNHE